MNVIIEIDLCCELIVRELSCEVLRLRTKNVHNLNINWSISDHEIRYAYLNALLLL